MITEIYNLLLKKMLIYLTSYELESQRSQGEMGRYILFTYGSLFLCICSYSPNVQTFKGNIYFIQNYMYDLKA